MPNDLELIERLVRDPFVTEWEARGSTGVLFAGVADEDTELDDELKPDRIASEAASQSWSRHRESGTTRSDSSDE